MRNRKYEVTAIVLTEYEPEMYLLDGIEPRRWEYVPVRERFTVFAKDSRNARTVARREYGLNRIVEVRKIR